jgi:hypothetical protein
MGRGGTPRKGAGSMATDSGQPAAGQDLGQQPTEGMPDDGWLLVQALNDGLKRKARKTLPLAISND